MKKAVLGCSQLVTLQGPPRPRTGSELRDLAIISDGAMLIENDRIIRVGPRAEIAPLDCEVIDAGQRVVMPGFVDAHTHPVFAGNRAAEFEQRAEGATYAEIAAAGGGIRSTVRQTRAATEDDLLAAAQKHIRWFLQNGTTTVEAKSGYGLTLEDESKLLRVIARLKPLRTIPTFLGAHEIPDEYRGRKQEYVRLVIDEMLPSIAKLAEYCDVFCEPNVFNIEDSREILAAARARGLGLRIHADQLSNSGASTLAAELARCNSGSSGTHRRARHPGTQSRRRPAHSAPRFGLRARLHALPARPRHDRRRPGRGFGDRFQSRLLTHAFHAHDPLARLHANENDALRSHHCRHLQRRVQSQPRP